MTTAIEQLGAYIAALGTGGVDAALDARLRLHIADSVAAWIAGADTPEGRALSRHWQHLRIGEGDAKVVVPDLVARNCALARMSEIDDIHLASMTTPGSIVAVGGLTIARALPGAAATDLGPAVLAGYEAMIRLGRAIDGPTMLYRGIWPTYFAAPFGIAAVAARLMRLDAAQTAHALALGLTLASPGVGHHNAATTSRWFAAGNAARNGLSAALAARSGITSDLNLVDGGFLRNVYGLDPKAAALTDGLGTPILDEVSFKPWCAARQTMAATQGLCEILESGVQVADITAVRASVLPPHQKMIDHGVTAGDRFSHLTSVQYQMAVAAIRPDVATWLSQWHGELDAPMQAFMARITVEADDTLLAGYPAAWPARVSVTTAAGTQERAVSYVPGDPARPFGKEDLAKKFQGFTGHMVFSEFFGAIVDGRVEDIPSLVDRIEHACRP